MQRRSPYVSTLVAAALLALPATAQKANQLADQQLAAFYQGDAWRSFLDQNGGDWSIDWCRATGTPRSILGSGIPLAGWTQNTIEEARRHAWRLLQDESALLGLGNCEFRESTGARMGRTWCFVFDQYYNGLRCIGGRADVRVHMIGRVPMFGATAWQIPAGFSTTPAIADEVATAIAWQNLGQSPNGVAQPVATPAPRLVIWGDPLADQAQTPSLAWEVHVSNVDQNGAGPIGRYYVDAQTGGVLAFENDKHDCGFDHVPPPVPVNTTVTVMGWTNVGIDAYDALTNVPMPGLVVNVPGIGNVTTDNNGQFTINIAAAVNISVGQLDGRHHAPIVGGSSPSANVTVNPGVNATIQLLTSGASSAQAAHTNTSYWLDKANEWVRTIVGNSSQMNTADNVVPTVNIASTCNAYYTGNTINFYQAGGGCSNTANVTVVVHEWGHGIDDRYGGISNTSFEGLSEGWGDIFGEYIVDSPNLGSGFQTAGVPLRSGNNTTQYHTVSEVHSAGESWMGFAWKLRDHLATTLGNRPAAIALTNTIVIGTIVANATTQPTAVNEVFVADDDDGNLSNGTPHSADLIWACNQHSLPYPGGGGGGTPANDDCAAAVSLVNGINGPFTSVLATTSTPVWPCAAGANDVWFTYNSIGTGTLTVQTCGQASWDTALQIFSGSCASLTSLACNDDSCSLQSLVSTTVAPGTYYIRVGGYNGATGLFSLNVSGPGTTVPAAVTPYGTGCYNTSRGFYEMVTGPAFDLNGLAMRLTKVGNHYVASAAGSYVAPSGSATNLALTDDSQTTVTLSGSFPYPGGSTGSLVVCSNGFVSPSTANGTAYTPVVATWLASAAPRWGSWHDFNPGAGGAVRFEQIGSIAYVTWDAVYSFGTTSPNTMQLQFDVSNGNVTYVWQSMVASGNSFLTGFASGTADTDLGSRDISVTLPGGFSTSDANGTPLALASTLPQLGTTATLTTSAFPPTSLLGLQILSTTKFDPGVDLTVIGMPGCFLYADLTAMYVLLPALNQATYALTVPNNPSLNGAHILAQSTAFAAGANPFGMVSSNGVDLTLGL